MACSPGNIVLLADLPDGTSFGVGDRWYEHITLQVDGRSGDESGEEGEDEEEVAHEGGGRGHHD